MTRPPVPTRRALAALAGVLLLALAASACGDEEAKTLDRVATQSAVGRVVADRAGAKVAKTTCPSSIPQGKGKEVACTVSLAKVSTVVRVTVRQVDEDAKLDVVLRDAILDNEAITADLKKHLKASFSRSFQADCGSGIRVVEPGASFRCTARDKVGRRAVLVRVKDAAGTVAYQVLS